MESKYPHLTKAPIIEAVFEIKTVPISTWEESARKAEIESLYPSGYTFESETLFQQTLGFMPAQPEQSVQQVVSWNGVRIISAEKTEVIKFCRDSFSYSRLKPYIDWEDFSCKSLTHYEQYKTINKSAGIIKRLGIRFINSIDYDGSDISHYLKHPPVKVSTVEMNFNGFLHHNNYSIQSEGLQINHIQMLKPPSGNQKNASLIIDVDVFIDMIKPDFNIESKLSRIRELKNDIFFGSLTDDLIGRLS